MYISITNSNQSFGAAINKQSDTMRYVYAYLEKYKGATSPYGGTKKELSLLNAVDKALKHHPSREIITITTFHKKDYKYGERVRISTTKADFKDVEPCKEGSVGTVLGCIRKVLDPENKDMFNALTGKQYTEAYPEWWNKYIAPIWKSISMSFREKNPPYPHIKDSEYNIYFRNQMDIYDVVG